MAAPAPLPPVGAGPPGDESVRYTVVPILYATDRAATGANRPQDFYGGARGDGQLAFGTAEVSIPEDHRLGELEAPSYFKLQFRADPEKHVVLLTVEPLAEDAFVETARQRVAGADKNDVLVFMHGYNVAFEDAARRTAQVAYDLQFPGTPVLYSWPSEGKTSSYTVDEANVMWTRPHFKRFVEILLTQLGANAVHVIAHSMGNRALAEMLDDFDPAQLPAGAAALHHIVFAAPDIDAQTFEELAAQFHGRAKRFTLYASSKDLALGLSKKVHRYGRAGAVGVVSEVIDTVDASMVDTDMLGHSYFGDSRTVMSDLFNLINHDMPPEKRHGLEAVTVEKGQIWRFRA